MADKKSDKSLTFDEMMWLALHTKKKTRKEWDEIRKREKQKKQTKKKN